MDEDLGRFFTAVPFQPGKREPIPLEEIRKMLIKTLTNMDEKQVENMADAIVGLIKELRESKK